MLGLLSMTKPTSNNKALSDDGQIVSMQEELNQFQRNNVWYLVPKPSQKNITRTKSVFKKMFNKQRRKQQQDMSEVVQRYDFLSSNSL